MGLDIYHEKATLLKPAGLLTPDCDVLLRANWAEYGFNVGYEHFHRYAQLVDVPVPVCTLIMFESPLDQLRSFFAVDSTIDGFRADGYHIIDQLTVAGRARAIQQLEQRQSLAGLPRHEWTAQWWRGRTYYREEPQEGFYVTEVGYQRKGVNGHFYQYFGSDEKYARRADFEYAYQCVDRYWSSDTAADVAERRARFQADFLDSYEEGASFLVPSY
ncbi:hypothetical protein EJV47_07340 [Hymenobacter gummosus]|uniref:Uncharacterized protein n=1 Tax=Hymenobacter gummosus TaxID=1776032 RepID=A0A3S0JC04_9BACT|nr:hypothetical protein [Hymenobacter gummosus]RTQ51606.1 hypothetical protein EJV47_07340 [Hymenobacter gummosus]